jgi:hypothetical protein
MCAYIYYIYIYVHANQSPHTHTYTHKHVHTQARQCVGCDRPPPRHWTALILALLEVAQQAAPHAPFSGVACCARLIHRESKNVEAGCPSRTFSGVAVMCAIIVCRVDSGQVAMYV